ncbi:hypothetical protein Pcinc_029165 [Petrolisthes cinctipes]|uniref:Calponin-homology (CH) domain-containing protein n=1 Tax=Petrolisthes cinctipes TaxID=88211 RepID=A0AAE1F0P2_PETCI|nr:hypothetical protein Pcinc_029165 [Petrolisthes cinctipes]
MARCNTDEQERVQKKTFMNWINAHLSRHVPPLKLSELIEGLKDGTALLALLEVLSGEKLPIEKGRVLRRPHFLSNANTALQFLQSKRIKLVNINPTDLVDGRPSVVLGLIWTIILYFQIEENTRQLERLSQLMEQEAGPRSDSPFSVASASECTISRDRPSVTRRSAAAEKWKMGAKKALLEWVRQTITTKFGIIVNDFGSSWRDGTAFLALIHCINPRLVNLQSMNQLTNKARLEAAFRIADKGLGIPSLLDPEDVDVDKPDEKSIMTYVASFLHKFPEPGTTSVPTCTSPSLDSGASGDMFSEIELEYTELTTWLCHTSKWLDTLHDPATHGNINYERFKALKSEADEKRVIYEKLQGLVESKSSMISITVDSWQGIIASWNKVSQQLSHWTWLLDASLPGALGPIGEWLSRAEAMLGTEVKLHGKNDEIATLLSKKIEEHKQFFSELPSIQSKFEVVKNCPDAGTIPPKQLEYMDLRLKTIAPRAAQRKIKLKYLEHRYCLVAFLILVEAKLKTWAVKYGKEQEVQQILTEYRSFIGTRNIFHEFDRAFHEMQQVSEAYKKDSNLSKAEVDSIARFLLEMNERWKNVSVELRCIQSLLEEVITYWKKFLELTQQFEVWLERASAKIGLSEEDKMDFFQDLGEWKGRHDEMNETGNFLAATCRVEVAQEIHDKLITINTKWEDLFKAMSGGEATTWEYVQQYLHRGQVIKTKNDYRSGQDRLELWLENAELILTATNDCTVEAIKEYGEKLKKLNSEIEEMEILFKNVSKAFQALVQDLNPDEIERMMWSLKQEKEEVVRYRAVIPQKMYLTTQIITQLEAIEGGITEINQWLDDGEALLASFTLHGTNENMQEQLSAHKSAVPESPFSYSGINESARTQLEKHRAFFSRQLYYKSNLDTKNRVYQNLLRTTNGGENLNIQDLQGKTNDLNSRFSRVTTASVKWETRMSESIRCWQCFKECESEVTEWITNAEKLYQEKAITTKSYLESHKDFFINAPEHLLVKVVTSGQDLQKYVAEPEQEAISEAIKSLQNRWDEVMCHAPLHLLKLEFRLDENTFQMYVRDIERELANEQNSYNKNENVEAIRRRHEEFFAEQLISRVEELFDNMDRSSQEYRKKKDDKGLVEDCQRCSVQWLDLQTRIGTMASQLDQIPERWKEYENKVEETVVWMDGVNDCLKEINREAASAEDYEKLKDKYVSMCGDMESRRESMKWLVQMLDSLITHIPEEDGQYEQKKLESLIARYKALVPTIESALVRAETNTKCYHYRENMEKVLATLETITNQSEGSPKAETLESIQTLIHEQGIIVRQLEDQRDSVFSIIQRGKDLSRDQNAPLFVSAWLQTLEAKWTETYNSSMDKLNKLKNTQKVWSDYSDQKNEILKLISQAESELSSVISQSNPQQVANELSNKQEMNEHLNETTDHMLRKLHSHSNNLVKLADPEKKSLLEKEVVEIEQRMQVVIDTVTEKIEFLEQLNVKWVHFTGTLQELRSWLINSQNILERLVTLEMTPEDRDKQTIDLQAKINEKLAVIRTLEEEAEELLEGEPSSDALQFSAELSELKMNVSTLKKHTEKHAETAHSDLIHWKEYQKEIQEIKPWLESAETKVAVGLNKPNSIREAVQTAEVMKEFEKQCDSYLDKLRSVSSKSAQVARLCSVVDEIDALHSRWSAIHDVALQWSERSESLLAEWEDFNYKCDAVSSWVHQMEGRLEKVSEYAPTVLRLEDRVSNLKDMIKEVGEKQTDIINLTAVGDHISPCLGTEGNTSVKSTLHDLKVTIAKLSEEMHKLKNSLSDISIIRQEFLGKVDKLESWLNNFSNHLDEIEDIDVDELDGCPDLIHRLQQEHDEKQDEVTLLAEECRDVGDRCTGRDRDDLFTQFDDAEARFENYGEVLTTKKPAILKWKDFCEWQHNTEDVLKGITRQLDAKPNLEDLSQMRKELQNINEQCQSWDDESSYIMDLCRKSSTTISDPDTGASLDINAKVTEFKKKMDLLEGQLDGKEDQLQVVSNLWEAFHQAKNQLSEFLELMTERVKNKELTQSSCEGVEHLLEIIENALEEMQSHLKAKDKLHDLGRELMSSDSTQLVSVQNSLTAADGSWDRTQNMLYEMQTKFTSITSLWKQCTEGQEFLQAAISEAQKNSETLENKPTEASSVQSMLNLCKKTTDSLRKTRPQLENFISKSQHLSQQLDSEEGFSSTSVCQQSQETQSKWQTMLDMLNQRSQNLEGQMVLWKQIMIGKDEILSWLNDICEELDENEDIENLEETSQKLEKYKHDLPNYESQFRSLQNRAKQLQSLNSGTALGRIEEIISTITSEIEQTESVASKLGSYIEEIKELEMSIFDDIKDINESLTRVRDRLMKCEDITGDDKKIIVRLESARNIEDELDDSCEKIDGIRAQIEQLKENFSGFDSSKIVKEYSLLHKKYEGIVAHTAKVCKSLYSVIEKHYQDRLSAVQRFITVHQEKITWYQTEPGNDRYSVEAKLSSLADLKASLKLGEAKRKDLESSQELYEQIVDEDETEGIQNECESAIAELEELDDSLDKCQSSLNHSLALWQQYELMSENLSSWLREVEAQVRVETTTQIDMAMVQEKIEETEGLLDEINNHDEELCELVEKTEELLEITPDCRAGEYATQIQSRVQALLQFCNTFLNKLNKLTKDKKLYGETIVKMEAWLRDAETKLKDFEQMTRSGGKPTLAYQSKLQSLKSFVEEKKNGQQLLNAVVEHGEALFSAITPEGREKIRSDLRTLRDNWEAHLDKVNQLYKRVESIIMQWSSFDENFSQASKWLEEIQTRAGSSFDLKASLADKKVLLQQYKSIYQDINSHESMIYGLKEKIEFLTDEETSETVDEMINLYCEVNLKTQQRITKYEEYIQQHELYLQKTEKFRDWLTSQKNELAMSADVSPESSDVQVKMSILDTLNMNEAEGQALLDECEESLEMTLMNTDPAGHAATRADLDTQIGSWGALKAEISEGKKKVQGIMSQFNHCEQMVQSLKDWMRVVEIRVKDQSLKSTLVAKENHLDRLGQLEEEIVNKAPEINEALVQAQGMDSEGKHVVQISQLSSRYQALKNVLKEMMNRYEHFIREHKTFLDKYQECSEWVEAVDHDLREHAEIVGDMKILQNRRNKVEQLIELKSSQANKVEAVLELGERLYSHTAPDGRENIRQMLRDLRERWETWCESVTNAGATLDQCLQQFSDFSGAQEQLTRWLKDVELAMQQHTELKNSLQEKTAQLQNHRLVHQEIQAHQNLVETVCEKAQTLVNQTQDKTLNVYIQSIQTLFHNIVLKSRDLQEKLDICAQDHAQFNTLCKSFGDWLNQQRDQLHLCADVSGEKSDLNKKLDMLKDFDTAHEVGDKKLLELCTLGEKVAMSTSERGGKALRATITSMEDAWNQHIAAVVDVRENLTSTLQQWSQFEEEIDVHTSWCKEQESFFKDLPLCATLEEKQARIEELVQKREDVVRYEREIDMFVDQSHALVRISNVERLKPLITQLSNRYQSLHVLTKEALTRLRGVLSDHQVFQEKFEENDKWLTTIEESLADFLSETDPERRESLLQYLLSEREQATHRLGSITTIGERLYPDTATSGRERLRQDLRGMRERWERIENSITEQQRQQEAQSLQWASFSDSMQAARNWLDNMEKTVSVDPSNWLSLQELRSRLLKFKTALHDITSHKRVMDSIKERAGYLLEASPNNKDVMEAIEEVESRHEALASRTKTNIEDLEGMIDRLTTHQDLSLSHADWQKDMWEKLHSYTDYSGNKSVLQTRLDRVCGLENAKCDGRNMIVQISSHAHQLMEKLPARAKETLERDINNLKYELAKFASTLADVKHGLEERLQQWNDYEGTFDRIISWLSESEASLKNYTAKSTLQEKTEQLERFQEFLRVVDSRHVLVQEFVAIADNLEQGLVFSIMQNQGEVDKMSDESSDLMGISADTRISVNVQQITSRFKSIQVTAKEILKKCEIGVNNHKAFIEKYNQSVGWLTVAQDKLAKCVEMQGDRATLQKRLEIIKELLGEKQNALSLVNTTVEHGEKLYPSTSEDGREAIRIQLEDLQGAFDTLFDSSSTMERDLHSKMNRWTTFEDASENLKQWLKETLSQMPDDIELKTTLDEKRAQLQTYRILLHDILAKQQTILEVRDKAEGLPEKADRVKAFLESSTVQHQEMLQRVQSFLEQYEGIVSDHQAYTKAVYETQEWLEATHHTVEMWDESLCDHITLHANLEKLKNLQLSLPEEEPRILQIRTLGEKVIPGTIESGQIYIRNQIDITQQEWQGLNSLVVSTIEKVEATLNQWGDFEAMKDSIQAWLRETDSKLHAVNLNTTLTEKQETLELLKALQGEVRAKELEIDQLTERGQHLYQTSNSSRGSQVSELCARYQQISKKVKDVHTKWHQYVTYHADYDSRVSECHNWLQDIKKKLGYCSDLSATSQEDLDQKMETIQDLLLYKEEGFSKVQGTVELAQTVLAHTAPDGHDSINKAVEKLQQNWSALASKMVETKTYLDETIHRWAGFLENIHQLNKTIEHVEHTLSDVSQFQSTLSEKRAQLERLKSLEEKLRCEKYEVESLKLKASEMLASGQQAQAASQAQNILKQFENLSDRIKSLRGERETQYRDHRHYKEAYDDLHAFVNRTRDKIPALKQKNLGDRLSIETAVQALDTLLNRQAQGQILVDQLLHRGEVFLHSTSSSGQEHYKSEMRAVKESFEELFKDISKQKENLEKTVVQWRDYKDEYEKLSDWLQKADADMKAYKTMLYSSIGEKTQQVNNVKDLLESLVQHQTQLKKLNELSHTLQETHLDSFVQNQMRHLNSRYQVLINMAKDVLRKVEASFDQHRQYETYLKKAREWIDNARMVVRDCLDMSPDSGKESIERHLEIIQSLMKKQEEGQSLVHQAVNWGEKVLRNTRSDGRDIINESLEELQTDWDKLIKKLSNAKVTLETNLLQWADMNASYINMQQWISEREAKLLQLTSAVNASSKKSTGLSHRISTLSIGERKANLRRTSSIVQDIVSFEPMIESVTSKATESQTSQMKNNASEISNKYHNLSKQAKELLEKQKDMVDHHQEFVDAGNEFMHWLRAAKERMAKCAEPTGDKDTISGKATILKLLQNEQEEGQKKLDKAFTLAEKACNLADEEDKEVIEEEVAFLQDEFDNFLSQVGKTKNLLEMGIVKWTEYEDKFKECEEWLDKMDKNVQSYNKLQDNVQEKRAVLEEFQTTLQRIFDWQKTLDLLNMRAQLLLETCADSRVSNAVTQLTTKYNTLLSLAKEVMRRLEMHFQEHHQHNQLYSECNDWIEQTRKALNECSYETNYHEELGKQLVAVKAIKNTLEQGQHKLRYVLELKERVIMNTEQSGASKIQEDTENLRKEFDKLMSDIFSLHQTLSTKISRREETDKMRDTVVDWLDELKTKACEQGVLFSELSDKRAALEKYRILLRDIAAHFDMVERLAGKKTEEGYSEEEVDECLGKYDEIKKIVMQNIKTLEVYVKEHEAYHTVTVEASNWLRKTRITMQQFADSHGEKKEVIEKQQQQEDIAEELPEGEEIIEKAIELNKAIRHSTSPEGQEALRNEADSLRMEWENLQQMSIDIRRTMEKCLQTWDEFTESYKDLNEWLEEFQQQVSSEPEDPTPEDLDHWKELLVEANTKKVHLEILNDRCEVLMDYSAHTPVRDMTVHLQSLYANVLTNLQSLVVIAQKTLTDHTEFVTAKTEFEEWLQRSQGTVTDCQDDSGSEAEVRDKLDTLKLVSTRLSEGQHLLGVMSDTFTRALNLTHLDQQEQIREDFTRLRVDWDHFNISLTSTQSKLKNAVSRWEEFSEAQTRLDTWLVEVEEVLVDTPDSRGEVAEMRTFLDRYKHIALQIQEKHEEVNTLLDDAESFSEKAGDEGILECVEEAEAKWEHLSTRCAEITAQLEEEITDFSQYQLALQDTEKWLLQISFQLMAENSLYICNREQTEEQIESHNQQLEDIVDYQQTLDEVKNKGRKQIDRYIGSVPAIQDKIERQLHNIQESYNSVLGTANHIQKRLTESLAKFEEYEAILESIEKNLQEWKPIITEENDTSIQTMEEAKYHLECTRSWHNKLLGEKSRLAFAVQACEAATASISRPGSPQDVISQSIPESELAVRAKLEDLIEQIQARVSTISSSVSELEDLGRQNDSIKKWIDEYIIIVQEFKSRPAKLRSEASNLEISQMNDLRTKILEKQSILDELEIKQMNLAPDMADTDNREKMNQLEEEVTNLIDLRTTTNQQIDEYRSKLQQVYSWFDTIIKQLEKCDKSDNLDSAKKSAEVQQLWNQFEDALPMLEEQKNRAREIMVELSSLDVQQVEEQIRSVEKKYTDLQKRVGKKMQVIEMTRKGYEDSKADVLELQKWIREKLEYTKNLPLLGYTSKNTEVRLHEINNLSKEISAKKLLLNQLEKAVENLRGDIEESDLENLESLLKKTAEEQPTLYSSIMEVKNDMIVSYEERRSFEQSLDQVNAWLSGKQDEVVCPDLLPLRSENAVRVVEKYRRLDSELKQYAETSISGVKRQGSALFKDCTEEEKDSLHGVLTEVDDKVNNLRQTMSGTLNRLSNLLEARRDFEREVDIAQKWLHQAEVALQTDVKSLNTAEVLAEQLKKLETMEDEREAANKRVTSIANLCEDLLPYLTEADKFTLGEIVRDIQDKTSRVNSSIGDKTDQVRNTITYLRRNTELIVQTTQYFSSIQKEIKSLNRPVGRSVDDAQKLLASYQDALSKLHEFRKGFDGVHSRSNISIGEMRDVTKQQQDLSLVIEKHIARVRQLILVRQQYASLITEIVGFTNRYSAVVREIEKTEMTVTDKIHKYNDVITKIQECEAQLTSAQDKGSMICEEGTVEDHNAIMEQQQLVKNNLSSLRRQVEKRHSEHEVSAESHKRLHIELNMTMEWLLEQESELKSRPLLTLEVESANEELEAHEELAGDIEDQLKKIRDIQDRAKSEVGLPYILQERLSEAKMISSTFPLELESRLKYLEDAKMLRLDYEDFITKIRDWMKAARKRIIDVDSIDFEDVRSDLEDHIAFFSSEGLIGESLEQLGNIAERIVPSLTSEDQDQLTRELSDLTKELDNVTKSARDHKAQLEKNVQLALEYKKIVESARTLIEDANVNTMLNDTAINVAALRINLQRMDEERTRLYDQSYIITDFTEKANELLQLANKQSHVTIGNQLLEITRDWKAAMEGMENRRDALATLISQWQVYDVAIRSLEVGLNNLELRLHKDLDSSNIDNSDMNAVKEIVESLEEEAEDLAEEVEGLQSQAEGVLSYLHTVSAVAYTNAKEHLDRVTRRHPE